MKVTRQNYEIKCLHETRNVLAICTQRTILPKESSTGLASICLSIGRASEGLAGLCALLGEVGLLLSPAPALVVDLPLLSRRNDSRRDFLNDLRREIGASPAPDKSEIL